MIPALRRLRRSSKWIGGTIFITTKPLFPRSTSAPTLIVLPSDKTIGSFRPTTPSITTSCQLLIDRFGDRSTQSSVANAQPSRKCVPIASSVSFKPEKRRYSMERSSEGLALNPSRELATRFWQASQREAFTALYHPFVVALGRGTLPIGAFQRYIAQDVYFLAAFSDAYGLAIENTADAESKAALQGLQLGVQDELRQVHMSVGTSEEALTAIKPNPATFAYTEFLRSVASGDDGDDGSDAQVSSGVRRRRMAAYTIAAMTPCNRLYAFLGQEIKKALNEDTSSSAYAQWIDTYASREFNSTASQSERLVHELSGPFPGEVDVEVMMTLYLRAMELEVDFFAAQELAFSDESACPVPVPLFRSKMASSSRFVLILDFDLTCTVSDSCPVLADLSVSNLERETAVDGRATSSLVDSLRSRWNFLVDLYTQEYAQLLDTTLSAKELSSRESQQNARAFDPEGTWQVLEALGELEITANERVVDSGVLSGLRLADVKEAGGTIPLQDGCSALLKRISGDGLPLDAHILSVCWSRSIIEGCLLGGGLQFCNVHSNELEFNDQGVSTGNIVRRLQTAVDKEKCLMKIVNETEEKLKAEKFNSRKAFTVYVGDSVTDLLCLLRADIGIVVGDSSSLKRVAEATGISLVPLYSGLLVQQEGGTWTKLDRVLYRISNWHELHAFLLGS